MKLRALIFLTLLIGLPATTQAGLVGLWEFENSSNLSEATIGNDLTGGDPTIVPVAGISGGDGAASVSKGSEFTVTHGIAPNGGGSFVNEYTWLMDISYPAASAGKWMSLFQTNTGNSNDGDLFVRNSDAAIGISGPGYTANTTLADTWYRLILSVDNDSHFRIYVDGSQWLDGVAQSTDGRFALDPFFHILADENGDDETTFISNFAVWDEALDANAASALGGAGAAIPEPSGILLALIECLTLGLVNRNRICKK